MNTYASCMSRVASQWLIEIQPEKETYFRLPRILCLNLSKHLLEVNRLNNMAHFIHLGANNQRLLSWHIELSLKLKFLALANNRQSHGIRSSRGSKAVT